MRDVHRGAKRLTSLTISGMSENESKSEFTVVVTETLDATCADWLAQRVDLRWCKIDDGNPLGDDIAEADALIVRTYTQVNQALLNRAPKLKVVGRAGVALENIDVAACRARGVEVVHSPEANTQAVVEYVTGLMLTHLRELAYIDATTDAEAFHQLRKSLSGRQVNELTVGILGFGRIGKRIGQVMHVLGANVWACDVLPEVELRKAVSYPFEFVSHEQLYAGSDILTIHADGRESNHHLINAEAIAHFKPNQMFINAARGLLVDYHALGDWLGNHPEALAIVDVHDPEPPPVDYSLHNLNNVKLLPHLAARTDTALRNMSWVVKDIWRILNHQPPRYPAL